MRCPPATAPRVSRSIGAVVAALAVTTVLGSRPLAQPAVDDRIRACLWSEDAAARTTACRSLQNDTTLAAVTRMAFHETEVVLRAGRTFEDRESPALREELDITLSDGRQLLVIVELPSRYHDETSWPLLIAMHGGPPGNADQARQGAERILQAWSQAADAAGWIVAAPVMTSVVAVAPRTEDRLPYEVLRPEDVLTAIAGIGTRYRVDPNRVVSTGISLGSNFSIAYAAAMPDRLAAIVPVSTEGESREHLLRNLTHVPTYLLEGERDQNIRAIDGPRALNAILTTFGYDVTYREFGERSHEGFEEHYPDVLRWLADRPRAVYPRTVLRVPHDGIVAPARRFYWIEPDTRQAVVRASVAPAENQIDVTVRWARRIRLFLHDRLVDLDRPVQVRINGIQVEDRRVDRSVWVAVDQAKRLGDTERIFSAVLDVEIPQWETSIAEGQRLWTTLTPRHEEGTLSFWEMYAVRALEERFPSLGLEGTLTTEVDDMTLPGERAAVRIEAVDDQSPFAASNLQPGDLLLAVDDEPFFVGRGLDVLHGWLLRELTGTPRDYALLVSRNGREVTLTATLQLGAYAEP